MPSNGKRRRRAKRPPPSTTSSTRPGHNNHFAKCEKMAWRSTTNYTERPSYSGLPSEDLDLFFEEFYDYCDDYLGNYYDDDEMLDLAEQMLAGSAATLCSTLTFESFDDFKGSLYAHFVDDFYAPSYSGYPNEDVGDFILAVDTYCTNRGIIEEEDKADKAVELLDGEAATLGCKYRFDSLHDLSCYLSENFEDDSPLILDDSPLILDDSPLILDDEHAFYGEPEDEVYDFYFKLCDHFVAFNVPETEKLAYAESCLRGDAARDRAACGYPIYNFYVLMRYLAERQDALSASCSPKAVYMQDMLYEEHRYDTYVAKKTYQTEDAEFKNAEVWYTDSISPLAAHDAAVKGCTVLLTSTNALSASGTQPTGLADTTAVAAEHQVSVNHSLKEVQLETIQSTVPESEETCSSLDVPAYDKVYATTLIAPCIFQLAVSTVTSTMTAELRVDKPPTVEIAPPTPTDAAPEPALGPEIIMDIRPGPIPHAEPCKREFADSTVTPTMPANLRVDKPPTVEIAPPTPTDAAPEPALGPEIIPDVRPGPIPHAESRKREVSDNELILCSPPYNTITAPTPHTAITAPTPLKAKRRRRTRIKAPPPVLPRSGHATKHDRSRSLQKRPPERRRRSKPNVRLRRRDAQSKDRWKLRRIRQSRCKRQRRAKLQKPFQRRIKHRRRDARPRTRPAPFANPTPLHTRLRDRTVQHSDNSPPSAKTTRMQSDGSDHGRPPDAA